MLYFYKAAPALWHVPGAFASRHRRLHAETPAQQASLKHQAHSVRLRRTSEALSDTAIPALAYLSKIFQFCMKKEQVGREEPKG